MEVIASYEIEFEGQEINSSIVRGKFKSIEPSLERAAWDYNYPASGKYRATIVLVRFNQAGKQASEMIEEIENSFPRPVDTLELLALARLYPKLQLKNTIVGLTATTNYLAGETKAMLLGKCENDHKRAVFSMPLSWMWEYSNTFLFAALKNVKRIG